MSRSLQKRILVAAIALAAAVDQASAARHPHGHDGAAIANGIANVARDLTVPVGMQAFHAAPPTTKTPVAPIGFHEHEHAVMAAFGDHPFGRSFGLRGHGRPATAQADTVMAVAVDGTFGVAVPSPATTRRPGLHQH
ncbi:MAG: hypothetical protein AB7O56_11145 [Bauldia sp.]